MPAISNTAPVIAEARATPNKFTSEHLDAALQLAAEKLPPRQVAFVDHYVANGFNGSQAYKSAGYKTKTDAVARANASKIIAKHNVSTYLGWKLRQITARNDCQIDEGRLIRESNALAYAAITDVLDWDANGKVTVKPSADLPRETVAAIKKIRSVTRSIPQEDGPPIEETKIEVELHDKKSSLDLQARIAGMLRETKVADYSNYTLIMNFGAPSKNEKDVSPVAG